MGPHQLEQLVPILILGAIAAAIIGGLIGAILLRAAAEFSEKLQIEFGDAFLTVFLGTLANSGIALVIRVALESMAPPPEFRLVALICFYPLAFVIQSVVISRRHNVSLWKGLRISFYIALIWVVIFVAVAIVVIPLLFFMGLLHR
jgi:hypothetical protein